jgi:hypothetical protein
VVNNGTPVHGVFAGPLASGATTTFTFATPANLSAYGNYNLDVYTVNPSDQNILNDTASTTFYSGFNFIGNVYTQGFEANDFFADWSKLSVNGDAYTWEYPYTSATYAHGGTNSARFYNGSTNANGDWLFSRCFPLEAGRTYEISYWYRGGSTTVPSKLNLKYGLSATPGAMVNLIDSLPNILTTTYQQSVKRFVAPANGSYNFGWYAYTINGTTNMYLDDININYVPDQEAAVMNMSQPVAGCGLTNAEHVRIKIKNNGVNTINGNLTGYYRVGTAAPVSEVISATILPGDTLNYTFTTPLDMTALVHDSLFKIKAWVVLISDPVQSNDSVSKQVLSGYIPANPVVTNDTVIQNYPATLLASSPDPVYWYVNSSTTSSFFNGTSYTTPALTDTVTYWVAASTGSASFKITEITQYKSGTAATSPYPSWLTDASGDFDGIEISNLGSAAGDLTGYQLVFYSTDATYGVNATYNFLPGTTLASGQVLILDIKSTSGTDVAHNYYACGLAGNPQSSSAQGYILKLSLIHISEPTRPY